LSRTVRNLGMESSNKHRYIFLVCTDEQLDAPYQDVKEVRSVGRGLGYWGDMVVVLKNGDKIELRAVPQYVPFFTCYIKCSLGPICFSWSRRERSCIRRHRFLSSGTPSSAGRHIFPTSSAGLFRCSLSEPPQLSSVHTI
jgi:hypothetical protein